MKQTVASRQQQRANIYILKVWQLHMLAFDECLNI